MQDGLSGAVSVKGWGFAMLTSKLAARGSSPRYAAFDPAIPLFAPQEAIERVGGLRRCIR